MREQIRADIDAAVSFEFVMKKFYQRLQSLGYTIERRGSFLRVRPYGYNKFFRLDKLGAGYTEEDIQERILQNARQRNWIPISFYKPTLQEKPKGLYALYLHYCYLLDAIPKVIPKNPEAYAAIKEDVRRARMYSEHAKFLGKYNLNTTDDLSQHEQKVTSQIDALCKEWQTLRNKLRWIKDAEQMQPIREQIYAISGKIKPLRKELKMCRDIYARSTAIEKTVNQIEFPQETEKAKATFKENFYEDR